MTVVYTGSRSEHLSDVIQRILSELGGMYNFGTPRVTGRTDATVTITVEGVRV